MKNFLFYCLFFVSILTYGQNKITGSVADQEGMALPGATVIIQNTSIGVSTDFDGNFEIEVDKGQILDIFLQKNLLKNWQGLTSRMFL